MKCNLDCLQSEKYFHLLFYKLLDFFFLIKLTNKIVKNELHKNDAKDYKLICYCIMPNHVHLIFYLLEKSRSVSKFMQAIKRVSAYYANLELGKKGSFWQAESFDHIVRDEDELEKLIEYTLMNPVKAGLVEDWKSWKHSYLSDSL
ncbi:MAG: transposase [Melioribacteraceae bacterium]